MLPRINILIFLFVFLAASCTSYQAYNKEEALQLELKDSSQVVIGQDKWTDTSDCSGKVYINNPGNGLLITVEVTDDSVRTGNEASYQNDGIELYFDLRPERLRNRNLYEKGVFQAVIIPQPGEKNKAPISWYPEFYNSEVTGATAFTQLLPTGYIIQVFLPFSSLKMNHYWPRENFSFDIGINDADILNRESQMMWKGKSDNWDNPSNFEPLTLPGKPVKKILKPNILLIITDQQTMMAMSAYGNPYLRTPNMDAFAEWGIRFTQSYCTSPASSPSRSSIITGLMPSQTGVSYNNMSPDSSIRNMGHLFQEAGYRTVWAGKWHLPDEFPATKKIEKVPGFEVLRFISPEKITNKGDDMDAPLTDAIVKVLKRHIDKPLLLVASYLNPQDINEVAIKPDIYPQPPNMTSAPPPPTNFDISSGEPALIKDCRKSEANQPELFGTRNFTTAEWKNYLYHYYRMIERVDREIGKLIVTLENKGLDQNTIIVFTSVRGDGAAAHHWAGGYSPYEESVKTPLIICRFGKNLRNIEDNKHLVSGVDILPTVLDYAGIKIPENREGMSLKVIAENSDTSWRKMLVTEIAPDPKSPSKLARMVRYKNYKYVICSYGTPNEQLFDLSSDPGEMKNLAQDQRFSGVKQEITRMLQQWMEWTGNK